VTEMKALRSKISDMCGSVITATSIPLESTSELERQIMASFAFGMTFVVGQSEHLTPPQIHALSITMLVDAFEFTEGEAVAFTNDMIEAAGGGGNPTIRAIIHRGIDGHLQWISGRTEELEKNINSVLKAMRSRTN
jgi:hypothetical protein